jgi:16S rRNA A1518/A1519 N6-dimethyltransferase RsmA/KsgA/DIM1 with predicted DNA glycosylase/AP lyase activity
MRPQIKLALEFLNLQPGQTLIELGCGDGRVLLAAAQQGVKVVGYELNPLLFIICWLRTRRYRRLVKVRLADFWRADWPPADAIFGFILPKYMPKLDKKIMQENRTPIKVVSFAFPIPGRKPVKQQDGVYLYKY